MTTTLLIDSSNRYASAGIVRDGRPLATYTTEGNALAQLHRLIEHLLADHQALRRDITSVATVVGPGSWTGLHIGVTAAKTLAQLWDAPLLGLSMLDVICRDEIDRDGLLLPVIDAKHGNFYCAAYETSGDAAKEVLPGAKRSPEQIVEALPGELARVRLVGPAADLGAEALGRLSGTPVAWRRSDYPSPFAFARLIDEHHDREQHGDDRFAVVPDYMQEDFTAHEHEWEGKHR